MSTLPPRGRGLPSRSVVAAVALPALTAGLPADRWKSCAEAPTNIGSDATLPDRNEGADPAPERRLFEPAIELVVPEMYVSPLSATIRLSSIWIPIEPEPRTTAPEPEPLR